MIKFLRCTKGAAALEAAIITAFLMLLTVGVVDLGMAMFRMMQVNAAAQAGAMYGALHKSVKLSDFEGIMKAAAGDLADDIIITPSFRRVRCR